MRAGLPTRERPGIGQFQAFLGVEKRIWAFYLVMWVRRARRCYEKNGKSGFYSSRTGRPASKLARLRRKAATTGSEAPWLSSSRSALREDATALS